MEAGLADLFAIEKNGKLSRFGYSVNVFIILSCTGTMIYPLLDAGGILQAHCLFKTITGIPCPTCGYSTAIGCLIEGNLLKSFLHNPAWVFWLAFQGGLIFIGLKSIITAKQAVISARLLIILAVILALTWAGKFIIGPEYY